MNKLLYKGMIYESLDDKKFIIFKNEFRLSVNNVVVSKTGYNIEEPDKWFNEKYVTLYDLKTFEKFKGKGYAKSLLNQIFKYVKNKLNLNIISLIVYKDNEKAMKLYFKMGFEVFMEYDDSYSLIKKLS